MNAKVGIIALAVSACRAAPIPAAEQYPAGTRFVARYVRVLGSNIRYIDAGRGTPVIFLHGLGGSIYSWRKNLPAAESAGFRVIAFDNRGMGSSDKPRSGYHNADYVQLLMAFMDSLHLPDAVLVGHSMGGAIAAEAALTNPKRVRGLVLVDAAGLGVLKPKLLRIVSPKLLAPFLGLRGRWITALVLRSTYADPSRITERDVDQYYAPVANADYGRALRAILHEFRFDALSGRLQGLDVPTLVLWGERDRWIPMAMGMQLAAELPRAAYVPIPNAGHLAPEEAMAAVNRSLVAFLRDGVPRAPSDLALRGPEAILFSTIRLRNSAGETQTQQSTRFTNPGRGQ